MSRDETPLVRDVPDDEDYTYVHRVFLQSFMTYGVMTVDELKPVLAAIMTAHSKLTISPLQQTYSPLPRPRPSLPSRRRNPTLHNLDPPNHKLKNRALQPRNPQHAQPAHKNPNLRPRKQNLRLPHPTRNPLHRIRNSIHPAPPRRHVRHKQHAHTRNHGGKANGRLSARAATTCTPKPSSQHARRGRDIPSPRHRNNNGRS